MLHSKHKHKRQQSHILAMAYDTIVYRKEEEKNAYSNNLNGGGSITFEKRGKKK